MNPTGIRTEEELRDELARKIAESSGPRGAVIVGREDAAESPQRPCGDSACQEAPVRFRMIGYDRLLGLLDGGKAEEELRRLCDGADRVLVYPVPDAPGEASCDQSWERLLEGFARSGLYDDLLSWPSCPQGRTVCFAKREDVCGQLLAYDRSLREKERALAQAISGKEQAQEELRACREALLREKLRRRREKQQHQKRIDALNRDIDSYQHSDTWRTMSPYRSVMDRFKTTQAGRWLQYTKLKGLRAGLNKAGRKIASRIAGNRSAYRISRAERARQEKIDASIRISIVVPLYNTPEGFLREMIDSVQRQTYSNWELCLADGSDADHREVGEIVGAYQKDGRIRYKRLERNLGISENTNACMDMATGEYIALLDHDDLLHPSALYWVARAIQEKGADFIYTDENTFHHTPEDAYCPHYKPDYAPDTLRSYNYICHFTVFRAALLEQTGRFRSGFDGSQDYDMVLRLTEKAKTIVHIPRILYYWRSHADSVASDVSAKPYALDAAKRALAEHLERIGLEGEVTDSKIPSIYHIKYRIRNRGRVSILIPNKDHKDDLEICIESIRDVTTYEDWEIIVIENNSTEKRTFRYYQELQQDSRIRVVEWKGEFNYSAINNFGAQYARGEYLLLLNNDMEIITPDWLEQMIMYAQREDVGAVGCMLYYPDDTVQHAGVIVGIGHTAGHAFKFLRRGECGYMSRMTLVQNYSAVTAACMMMRRRVWDEVGGLDEAYRVAFNDADLCLRIREAGYLIVFTPYAELYHYESKSRGFEDTPEKQRRLDGEIRRFRSRWRKLLEEGDPYYNPNLTLSAEDFSQKD